MSDRVVLQPHQVSEAEWQVRCDLAACYRAFVKYGWTDLIYTHISARHPERADGYLINPYGLLFDEITASNLIVVDFEGEVIAGDYPVNQAGHAIHSTVLKARNDVNWVLHTHTRAGMAVSGMHCGLRPLTQHAMYLHGQVAYHPWDVQTAGPEECERLVADLGDKKLMILHNHGLLACAATIGEAFTKLYLLETACKVQVDLMCSGSELVIPDDEIIERTAVHGVELTGQREWEAIRRLIERTDPCYRD